MEIVLDDVEKLREEHDEIIKQGEFKEGESYDEKIKELKKDLHNELEEEINAIINRQ